jgi:DnaJ-class molecular chaperone
MRRKPKSHYETLGVAADATPDQVKRAYRAKAQKHHPDKGGEAEQFAEVAAAYEVLSDPQRRLLYDTTGQDRERPPIEDEANQLLLTLFNQILSSGKTGNVLDFIREHLDGLTRSFKGDKARLSDRKRTLGKLRKKITSTAETNLAHVVIDNEMTAVEHAIADIDHKSAIVSACKELLESYSEEKDKESAAPRSIYFQSAGFDFTKGGFR